MSLLFGRLSPDDVLDASRCVVDERGRLYLPRDVRGHLGLTVGERVLALKGKEGEVVLLNRRAVERRLRP